MTSSEEMEVALRSEIKEGKAYIICELENGKKEQYEIEIEKIYISNNYDNKSMLIKVTDKRLLEKTRWNNSGNEWFSNCTKWKICAEQLHMCLLMSQHKGMQYLLI